MNPYAIEQENLLLRVVDAIQASIHNGIYREYLPGERSLAGDLGVSRTIVRKALQILQKRGVIGIAQGKRTRILKYPRRAPRKRSKSVAVLAKCSMTQMSHSMALHILTLQMHLNQAGYSLNMHFKHTASTEGPPIHVMRQLVRNTPADCWVLFSGTLPMQRFFQNSGVPTFLIGRPNQGIKLPHFYIDTAPACRHAVGRALAAGHRKIGLLLDSSPTAGHEALRQAFLEGFDNRLGEGAEPVIIRYDLSRMSIENALAKAWRESVPTALIVTIPSACVGVLAFLADRRLRVPADVSVICLGNHPMMRNWSPGISCYRVDGDLHYSQCAKLILTLAKEGSLPDSNHFRIPEFEDRGSLGSPP